MPMGYHAQLQAKTLNLPMRQYQSCIRGLEINRPGTTTTSHLLILSLSSLTSSSTPPLKSSTIPPAAPKNFHTAFATSPAFRSFPGSVSSPFPSSCRSFSFNVSPLVPLTSPFSPSPELTGGSETSSPEALTIAPFSRERMSVDCTPAF